MKLDKEDGGANNNRSKLKLSPKDSHMTASQKSLKLFKLTGKSGGKVADSNNRSRLGKQHMSQSEQLFQNFVFVNPELPERDRLIL